MKVYSLYSKGKELELVKIGFSWPAFIFSWSWFFYHEMIPQSLLCLSFLILLSIESNNFTLVIGLFFLLYLGAFGNNLFEIKLLSNKWNPRFTVKANNYIEAWLGVYSQLVIDYRKSISNSTRNTSCNKETSKQT